MRKRPKIGLKSLAAAHQQRLMDRTVVRRGGESIAKQKPKRTTKLS